MLFFSFVFTFFCIRFCLRQFSRHVILRTCWLLKGSVEGLLSWSFYHSHSSQISHAFAFVRAFPSFPGLVSSVFWHLCFGRELQDVSTECNFHLLSPFGVYAGTLVIQILRFFLFCLQDPAPAEPPAAQAATAEAEAQILSANRNWQTGRFQPYESVGKAWESRCRQVLDRECSSHSEGTVLNGKSSQELREVTLALFLRWFLDFFVLSWSIVNMQMPSFPPVHFPGVQSLWCLCRQLSPWRWRLTRHFVMIWMIFVCSNSCSFRTRQAPK